MIIIYTLIALLAMVQLHIIWRIEKENKMLWKEIFITKQQLLNTINLFIDFLRHENEKMQ